MTDIARQTVSLDDKTIIVTGAGSGIGRATAILLAEAGASVVLAGTTPETLERTSAQIAAAGGKALIVKTDVGEERDIEALVAPHDRRPHWAEYTASKHAAVDLTRAASTETGETKVRVNAVLPGYIVTPMSSHLLEDPALKRANETALERHSIGRFGQSEDVGYAVRWLLSDEAAFVNGALLAVNGGFTAR